MPTPRRQDDVIGNFIVSRLGPQDYYDMFGAHCKRTKSLIQQIENLRQTTPLGKFGKRFHNAKLGGSSLKLDQLLDNADKRLYGLIGETREVPATVLRCKSDSLG